MFQRLTKLGLNTSFKTERIKRCINSLKTGNKPNVSFVRAFSHSQSAGRSPALFVPFSTIRATPLFQPACRNKLSLVLRRVNTSIASNPSVTPKLPANIDKIMGYWMLGCAGMVFGAVIIGGLTRLTESGLSMVEWRLIKDMKPPKTEDEWLVEFEKYQAYPEYQHVTSSRGEMSLSEFKFIWYMEFTHRMWGRATGLVFILPAAFLLAKGWVKKPMKIRMAVYTALLGFQGYLGWHMVKSGLAAQSDERAVPRVSQYRLAAHLSTALALYALFLWSGFTHLLPHQYNPRTLPIARLYKFAHANHALVFFTCVAGAFVAGLDAGLVYNSWPMMANRWIPDDLFAKSPKWKNFFENATTTQFVHRLLGHSVVLCAGGLWWVARAAPLTPRTRAAVNCVLAMSLIQASLGISTLLLYVPTWLAASHQGGALTMFTVALWLTHECRKLPK